MPQDRSISERVFCIINNIHSLPVKSKLGIIERKIFARKCIIKNITHLEKEFFLQENHIQGNCQSSTNLGLFFKDELVSVMTFGIRKITSSIPTTELLRFCNKIDTVVVGGASKLFNFFYKNKQTKKNNFIC